MKKSMAMRASEAQISTSRVNADRASLDRHDWKVGEEDRWYINGYVACRSGAHVNVNANWSFGVFMYVKWQGREYRFRVDEKCGSVESLRRAAVVFAARVVKGARPR